MSLKELYKYIPLSKETIYRRVYSKTIPFHRIGKKYVFSKDEIDAWVFNNGKRKKK